RPRSTPRATRPARATGPRRPPGPKASRRPMPATSAPGPTAERRLPRPERPPVKRLLLALAVFVTTLLVAEGAASIVLDRSLLRPYHVPGAEEPGPWLDHPDPLVGYTMRHEASLEILGGRVESDELGMRRRPGPPPEADAQRLLVVGDS